MTVSTTTSKASASANGTQHSFAYGFKIFADADLAVTVRAADGTETLKTLNTHYIVTNAGSSSGGNVLFKFNTGNSSDAHFSNTDQRPANGETVVIKRELTLTQGTDYVANDPFPAESHEDALDRLTFISQQQQEELDRTIKASVTNTISGAEFALSATDRANKIFAFDGSGDLSITQELGTFKGNWAASTDYVVRDIVKDSGTNNIFIVNTAHTSSGSLPLTTNTNSAKYDLIVDAASATTSQNAAAASASTASTQATNSANSATASANSATASANSATAAANSLTAFQDQYHGAASSDPSSNLDTGDLYFNTTTGIKVYTGSAWEDVKPSSSEQTNINSVASNASNINAVAGNSSNINSVAGNSTNINAVAGNSSNINAVAGNSSNINTVAGSDTNIGTVASNISGVNSFAERYRVGSSDPSSSLDAGDLFFNTSSNQLKFYNGSAFTAITPSGADPAIEDNSGTPVLATGITAAEVRTLIGAGTSSFDGAFASLSSKPTTLSGYGITDALANNAVSEIAADGVPFSVNSTNSNTFKIGLEDNGTTRGHIGASSSAVFVVGDGSGNVELSIDGSGNGTFTGNVTAFSDERLKSDIETLDGSRVYEMRGVSFTKNGLSGSGVLAQELEKVAPELVHKEGEYLSVAYGNITGYLIEALKEQDKRIQDQQKQIDELMQLVKVR